MSGTVRPTKKQQELLVYIEQFIGEHGYSPSYREIMNGCQYTSVATVALHVGNLIKRGHLRKRDHSARSIEVVKEAKNSTATDTSASDGMLGSQLAKATGEEWLLVQVEHLIRRAEKLPDLTEDAVDDIRAVLRTCSLVGLQSQTEALMNRFEGLQQKSLSDNAG